MVPSNNHRENRPKERENGLSPSDGGQQLAAEKSFISKALAQRPLPERRLQPLMSWRSDGNCRRTLSAAFSMGYEPHKMRWMLPGEICAPPPRFSDHCNSSRFRIMCHTGPQVWSARRGVRGPRARPVKVIMRDSQNFCFWLSTSGWRSLFRLGSLSSLAFSDAEHGSTPAM